MALQPVEQRRLPLFRPLAHQDLDGHAKHATLHGETGDQRGSDGQGGRDGNGGGGSAAVDGELHEADGRERRQEALVDGGVRRGPGGGRGEGVAGSDEVWYSVEVVSAKRLQVQLYGM